MRSLSVLLFLAFALYSVAQESAQEKSEGEPLGGNAELQRQLLDNVVKRLSPECNQELMKAMEDPSAITTKCKEELQTELGNLIREQAIPAEDVLGSDAAKAGKSSSEKKSSSDSSKSKKKSKGSKKKKKSKANGAEVKDRSGAITIVVGFVTALLAGLIGACWYINRQLEEAGIGKKEAKKLSKKKLEKQRRNIQRSAPAAE